MTTPDETRAAFFSEPAGEWQAIGHRMARRYLQRSQQSGRIAHAYLITGPDQVGKATLALDLARLVNCTPTGDMFESDVASPCGKCGPCDRISKGTHADVTVINPHTPIGTSTPSQDSTRTLIGIDHVREMQKVVSLKSFEGGVRVVIFDGADRMNDPGWNALLKTLEEPPEDVIIVLLAPAADSLPTTVISRCQPIELHTVTTDEITRELVKRGGMGSEDAGHLARIAAGRPGRAFAALTDETTLDRYRQGVLRVLTTSAGDIEVRFRYANEIAREFGRNRVTVLRELELWTSVWRDMMLLKHGITDSVVNIEWTAQLSEAASHAGSNDAQLAIEAIAKATDGLRRNGMPRVVLEVLLLELPSIPSRIIEKMNLSQRDDASNIDSDGWAS